MFETVKLKKGHGYSLGDLAAYCFYFPCVFGPFVSYQRHLDNNDLRLQGGSNEKSPSTHRPQSYRLVGMDFIRVFVRQTVVVTFWFFAIELMTHAYFPVALEFHMPMYLAADGWARCTLPWLMGQFFQVSSNTYSVR